MKRKLLSLLTLSLIVSSSSSCSLFGIFHKKEEPIVVTHTKVIRQTLIQCPKPQKPLYDKLDTTKPITDKDNLYKLLNNIAKMKSYCEMLEETIKCYEDQINEQQTLKESSNDEINKQSTN